LNSTISSSSSRSTGTDNSEALSKDKRQVAFGSKQYVAVDVITEYQQRAGAPMGEVPLLNLCRQLNLCREQLAQVLVELTDRIGISAE
jgi:hypothetical protein